MKFLYLFLVGLINVYAYNKIFIDNSNVMPLMYNIGNVKKYCKNKLNKLQFNNHPYCLYFDNEWKLISDVCIHRGCLLSSSHKLILNEKRQKCIKCNYHGWEYHDGMVVKIPGSLKSNYSMGVSKYLVKLKDDDLYINLSNHTDYEFLHIPEENNNKFVKIYGHLELPLSSEMVTENILDMMHISYVHSFGNTINPIPYGIEHSKINSLHGKTTYYYNSGPYSLSKILGMVNEIIVENEYYLPTMTITRVKAGWITKTIITHTIPIDENNCILYYKLYRNYLTNVIGDIFHHLQMRFTLEEDINILKNCDPKYYKGIVNTKYDVTQISRRNAIKKYLFNNNV